ncbi:hypothetical protein AB1I68_00365 [Paenibacillus pabuli]|uniref:hypothetical protein n=1 Tax=Paenibacillus pabuli TaxID=1472 RepID=UPI00345AFBB2
MSRADKYGLTSKPSTDTFAIITDPTHPYFNRPAYVNGWGSGGYLLVFQNGDYIEYPLKTDTLIRINTYDTMAYLRDTLKFLIELQEAYHKGNVSKASRSLEDAEKEIRDLRTLLVMDAVYWNIQKNTNGTFDPMDRIKKRHFANLHPDISELKTLAHVETMRQTIK